MPKDPLHEVVDPSTKYQQIAQQIVDFRDKQKAAFSASSTNCRAMCPRPS